MSIGGGMAGREQSAMDGISAFGEMIGFIETLLILITSPTQYGNYYFKKNT